MISGAWDTKSDITSRHTIVEIIPEKFLARSTLNAIVRNRMGQFTTEWLVAETLDSVKLKKVRKVLASWSVEAAVGRSVGRSSSVKVGVLDGMVDT